MNIIVAGQTGVTAEAEDACGICGYWRCRCKTVVGQNALRDIVEDLEHDAVSDVDFEDLAYYRSLLVAPVIRLADYRPAVQERGLAA